MEARIAYFESSPVLAFKCKNVVARNIVNMINPDITVASPFSTNMARINVATITATESLFIPWSGLDTPRKAAVQYQHHVCYIGA